MFLLYGSICIAARSPWTLILTLPLAITIRYGVVAREETYLVSGAAVRRRLSGLQGPRAPLAVAVEQERCQRRPYTLGGPCEITPDCDRRSVARACLLRDDADIPGGQRCRSDAPTIRGLGVGRGYCSHLGRSGVTSPADCRDRRPWHHLWDTARRIAGEPRPDQQRTSRLRPDAHLCTPICATLRWAPVPAQVGEFVRPGRCLGDRPHPQPSLQRPGGHGLSGRPCWYENRKIHHGAFHRQRAHRLCVCGDRCRLGRSADPGPRGELHPAHPAAAHRALSHARAPIVRNVRDTCHRSSRGFAACLRGTDVARRQTASTNTQHAPPRSRLPRAGR